MIVVSAILAVACFAVVFDRLNVVAAARQAIATGAATAERMRDPSLTDTDKEQAARSGSVALLRSFVTIAIRSAGALAASAVPLVVLNAAGLAPFGAVNALLLSPVGLGVASAAIVLLLLVRART